MALALAALLAASCSEKSATRPDGGGAGGVGDGGSGGAGGGSAGGASGSSGADAAADGARDARDIASDALADRAASDAAAPTPRACKRGIAANTPPGPALLPRVGWWYDWATRGTGPGVEAGIEFVPMIWGNDALTAALPASYRFLLGFNEPNFHAQSNLTAAQAAALWPMLEAKAAAAGARLVSPAMNFCGPAAADCNGTNPYQYLRDFFAACAGCRVDAVAVHWYNCDLPSLRDYLEPGGNLEGFESFGKPIWLTEFSCDGGASVAQQEAFMRAAIPYLEANPRVERYAWFSADPIPNARLLAAGGAPTALGQVYASLPGDCP